MTFTRVANLQDIPVGGGRCFDVSGKKIAVFRKETECLAIDDIQSKVWIIRLRYRDRHDGALRNRVIAADLARPCVVRRSPQLDRCS